LVFVALGGVISSRLWFGSAAKAALAALRIGLDVGTADL
jgi:hypothetical protein